jgi:hypothetical protein
MLPAILADLVLLLHLCFVAFVIAGGLLVLRHRRVAWLHLPMVLWSVVVNLSHWRCPLTPLENFLRLEAGQEGYAGGFLAHYLTPLIYPQAPQWNLGLVIGLGVMIWNTLLYGIILWRLRKHRR